MKKQKKNTKQEFDERVQVAVKDFAEQVGFVNKQPVWGTGKHFFRCKLGDEHGCQSRQAPSAGKGASGVMPTKA